jgi:hypothetical protein
MITRVKRTILSENRINGNNQTHPFNSEVPNPFNPPCILSKTSILVIFQVILKTDTKSAV